MEDTANDMVQRARADPIALIVGGEQFTLELAEKIDRQFGDVRIFNEYGPTEAVVGCMIHQFDPETDRQSAAGVIGSSSVPIGVPAEHTRIYVLNSARQPVHPGVTGELYVFREGAPQAYFENPEATAAAFFPDLVAPDRQMYRTGDLARFNERGELVFLGRADQQLKIAGHRVETEEIESTIMRIADVDACSVILDSPPEASSTVVHCSSCGIGSDTPGIRLDENDKCKDRANKMVRKMRDFELQLKGLTDDLGHMNRWMEMLQDTLPRLAALESAIDRRSMGSSRPAGSDDDQDSY